MIFLRRGSNQWVNRASRQKIANKLYIVPQCPKCV